MAILFFSALAGNNCAVSQWLYKRPLFPHSVKRLADPPPDFLKEVSLWRLKVTVGKDALTLANDVSLISE